MKKWTLIEKDGYNLIVNEGGKTLGYAPGSGIQIIEVDGFAFKDLNRNGQLDPYEDWRLPVEERVKNLASLLSIEDIAGLMLYSAHQSISTPSAGGTFARRFSGTYDGKSFGESGAKISDLSDQQKEFLGKDKLRHVLMTAVDSPEVAARWNNNVQAFVEGLDKGIPANNSSDPRHSAESNGEFLVGSDGKISQWPSTLGMAATFSPEEVKKFGEIASKEYRALGIATALSPQIDLATEPRWGRFSGTFGEGTKLAVDMARAYCDGFQTSEGDAEIENGWGADSVNAMIKHWPGGGAGEGGRDAHFSYGKYAVYPGDNFKEAMLPFTEGALKLDGPTKRAAAVMPYYTISYGQDKKYGENVGNSYSKYIIRDTLRGDYEFDGVACTDWGITHDYKEVDGFATTCWGTEHMNETERHYKAIMAGIDQFGGNNVAQPILDAYTMGSAAYGEEFMRQRMEQSACRLLRNIFNTGLFENAYLDPSESSKKVGCADYMKAGYEMQLKSIVMLKNKNNVLPLKKGKVYIPKRPGGAAGGMLGGRFGGGSREPYAAVDEKIVKKYFDIAETPDEADFAIVFMDSPSSAGYDRNRGGYLPISLQYRPYKAVLAREVSIASGDPNEWENPNRSYKDRENTTSNEKDLDILLETRAAMGSKPVICVLTMSNPTVMAEFEKSCDAILVDFRVQSQAVLDVISGAYEPTGLMPCQTPASMDTVETQYEDVPRDMVCHQDECGNTYDFAFGLNWSGVINDDRVKAYK